MSRININTSLLNKAINNAFAEVVARMDVESLAVIEDPNEFADVGLENRDIVDTGRFRDSQVVDVQSNKATFSWNPHDPETGYPYAAALWFGFFAFGGTKYIPGRKWFLRAAKRVDPVLLLAEELQKQGITARVVRNDVGLLD